MHRNKGDKCARFKYLYSRFLHTCDWTISVRRPRKRMKENCTSRFLVLPVVQDSGPDGWVEPFFFGASHPINEAGIQVDRHFRPGSIRAVT